MVRAQRLETALDAAQARGLRLELVGGALDLAQVLLRLGLGVLLAHQPEDVLLQRRLLGERLVGPRDLGLVRQLFDLRLELAPDVVHACEVLAGVLASMTREIIPCSMIA